MFPFLFQPYPSQKNIKHTISMSFIAGVCVFCIFYFIKPFNLSQLPNSKIAIIGFKYSLVTLILSLFCTTGITNAFPKWFNEKHWKVWHEILFLFLMIFIIAIGNVLLTTYIFKQPLSAYLFFNIFKYTVAFGMAPIVISVLIKQQNLLHKYSAEAKQIEALIIQNKNLENITESKVLAKEAEEIYKPQVEEPQLIVANETKAIKTLEIKGNNQTEVLTISETDFIFAEAADNYTTIHYLLQQETKQVLYRMTIKNLESQTTETQHFFRCHKSFLVNLSYVNHISGNAQGYKLHLLNHSTIVPVSRTLNAVIKNKLANLQPINA